MAENSADSFVFDDAPTVQFATNTFANVPVILQYDDTPLLEVIQRSDGRFTTRFNVYDSDGLHLARVEGTRLLLTPDGHQADLVLRHSDGIAVCELYGEPVFEIYRQNTTAMRIEAGLYTPDGSFLWARDGEWSGTILRDADRPLPVASLCIRESTFDHSAIGIQVYSHGGVRIGGEDRWGISLLCDDLVT